MAVTKDVGNGIIELAVSTDEYPEDAAIESIAFAATGNGTMLVQSILTDGVIARFQPDANNRHHQVFINRTVMGGIKITYTTATGVTTVYLKKG